MWSGVVVAAAALGFPLGAPPTGTAFEVHIRVNRSITEVGQPVGIELRSYSLDRGVRILADGPGRRLRVETVSPARRVTRVQLRHVAQGVWQGTIRFAATGKWQVRVGNWPMGGQGPRVAVDVRPAGPTPAPAGFGPLGRAGCAPPSPRNQRGDALARTEVFGTTLRGRFWGLFGFVPVADGWASDGAAVLQHIVGKEMKIVFKLTGGLTTFYAVSPNGTTTRPVWGPDFHDSSSWGRAGIEWGAGFVFDQAGCWRIHAENAQATGDLWLVIRS